MILFLDTSTPSARLWLDENYFEKEINRNMARDIIKFIEDCLAERYLTWQDLKGLAVFAGPGSFTGLRIGATVMNTLSDGLIIPIVSVKNSDSSKIFEGVEDWRDLAKDRLRNQENDKIAQPFYGAGANITKPRK